MKNPRLSNKRINAFDLPPEGQNKTLYPDSELPGHYVCVTQAGARSFVVDKFRKREHHFHVIGPAGTDRLTPLQSRQKAQMALGWIAEGLSRQQVRDRLDRSQDIVPDDAVTLGEVLRQLLRERNHKLAARTRSDYQKLADTYLTDWKARPLEAIDEDAVVAKFNSIAAPSRANYTFRLVRLLFNYAKSIRDENGEPIVERNPVDVLSQRKLWHTEKPKREVIELAAIGAWWKAVHALKAGEPERDADGRFKPGTSGPHSNADAARDFLVFLLLTGLRRNEAATLKWADVDLRGRYFTVSAETKNHEPHALPLSDHLQTLLERRQAEMVQLDAASPARVYVFAGDKGPLAEPKKQISKVVADSGVSFSSHTLRRTFASIAESIDIPYLALKRMLNHKAQDVTGKHYTVIGVERLRDPMQRVTDFILKAAGERESAEVIQIAAKGV